ncbi:MAG: ElyC/SanA/YdcF family protein [Actinomycetota bacterium]
MLGVLGLTLVFGPAAYVRHATRGRIYHPADVPGEPVAIVFGAGVHGGEPSPFLARRLDIAIGLFQRGQVRGLLMTGDNSREDYDEVGIMARYAAGRGVPAAAIGQDHAGFNTYDSCYRARVIFGVRRAVVVTQSFHVRRATFLCRQLGLEADGVGDDTSDTWPGETRKSQVRELLATMKALWQTQVSKPTPHFLGPHENALDQVLAAG